MRGKEGVIKKFIILVVFLINCLEKPQLPEWETEFTIPLLEKEFVISSFLDSNYLVINSDSTINVLYRNNLDTIFLIEKVNLGDITFEKTCYLNYFCISDTFASELIINGEEILGIPISDSYVILPPISQQRVVERLINISNIRNCEIEEAELLIRIENHSSINFEYLNIQLEQGDFNLGNIPPHSRTELSFPISNIYLSSPIRGLLAYQISNGDSVLVRRNDYLRLLLKFTNLKIKGGEIKLKKGGLKYIHNCCLIPDTEFDIDYCEIKEGYLYLDLINQFPFPLFINLTIPELSYRDSINISAFSNQRVISSLQEKTIAKNFSDREGIFLNIRIDAQIRDTENFFNISQGNNFSIIGQIRSIRLKEIVGNFLVPFYFLDEYDSLQFNFFGNCKGIKLAEGEVSLDFTYNTKIPSEILFKMKKINRGQKTCSLCKEIMLPLTEQSFSCQKREKIALSNTINGGVGTLEFNCQGMVKGKGEIEERDFIFVDITLDIPLSLSFEPDTFIAYESEISLDEEKRKDVERDLIGGQVIIEWANHFPFGFNGSLILTTEGDSLEFPFEVIRGIMSGRGYCVGERKDRIIWEIGREQLEIFKKEKVKALLRIELPKEDKVTLRANDFLSFKSYALLKVKTSELLKAN